MVGSQLGESGLCDLTSNQRYMSIQNKNRSNVQIYATAICYICLMNGWVMYTFNPLN